MANKEYNLGAWHFETPSFITTRQLTAWRKAEGSADEMERVTAIALALKESGFVQAVNFPIDQDSDFRPIRWLAEETAVEIARLIEIPKA